MLDEATLAYFRQLLEERRRALLALEESGRQASEVVELDQSRVGRLSRMDALQGQAMSLEAQRRRRLELAQLDAAIVRLEAGDYGYCLRCGEPIAIARLKLSPGVPLCTACADASEAG